MNILLLEPSDVLFFRDGRPMSGSLAGHGAAWPLPTVTNAALHAALHRAEIENVHAHRRGRSGSYSNDEKHRDRKFGSLVTAGPFPELENGTWLFPRPLDAGKPNCTDATYHPLSKDLCASSLPKPLEYPVANAEKPTKDTPAPWWNADAFAQYLTPTSGGSPAFHKDSDFSDTESTYGIGLDPTTGTQDGERFYSAQYLRLKPHCRLGLLAEAWDKIDNDSSNKRDLIQAIFPNSGKKTAIIAGGQQRVCTVERPCGASLPLPRSLIDDFKIEVETEEKSLVEMFLVKWVLLTPAIFPRIDEGTSKRGTQRKGHPGGWLPTWICPSTGDVLLQTINEDERKRRRKLNAEGKGYESKPDISAKLVAALTGKPIPVTGYALIPDPDRAAGPKSTHLAVPAGSVYYFQCKNEEAAKKLAAALNWHGQGDFTTIRNRRSTLFGEKGFGLGICGTWHPHKGNRPS